MQNQECATKTTNHKAGRYNCAFCDKRFIKPSLLRRHEVVHRAEKPFKCSQCPKLFTQQSSLLRHCSQQHGGDKKCYQCPKCPQSFSQRSNMLMHHKKVHPPAAVSAGFVGKPNSYACTICPSVYCNKQTLSRHINAVHKKYPNYDNPFVHTQMEDDDLTLTQNVLKQLQTFQIEMQAALETPMPKNDVIPVASENVSATNETVSCAVGTRRQYACDFCTKQFRKSYDFVRHRRIHTRERPYKCVSCERAFVTRSRLHEHQKLHRLDEQNGLLTKHYACAVCNAAFSSLRQLDKHMSTHAHAFAIAYKCKTCDASFKTSTALSTHKHMLIDEDLNNLKQLLPSPVVIYKHKFYSISELEEQLARIKPKWKCPSCSRISPSSSALNAHRRIYHDACSRNEHAAFSTTPVIHCYKCAYCSRLFKNYTRCNAHMLQHLTRLLETSSSVAATNQPQPKQQPLAIRPKYINALVILTDITNNAQITIKQFNATKASTTNNYKPKHMPSTACPALSRRKKSKATNKLHVCDICSKKFHKSCDLKRHLLTHTAERQHTCNKCGKSFSLSGTLKQHQQTHALQREKCVCIVCGKLYATKKSLNVHLRLHTGAQPLDCEQCDAKFRTSGQRIVHMRAMHGSC